jgi:hypothetical protein
MLAYQHPLQYRSVAQNTALIGCPVTGLLVNGLAVLPGTQVVLFFTQKACNKYFLYERSYMKLCAVWTKLLFLFSFPLCPLFSPSSPLPLHVLGEHHNYGSAIYHISRACERWPLLHKIMLINLCTKRTQSFNSSGLLNHTIKSVIWCSLTNVYKLRLPQQ